MKHWSNDFIFYHIYPLGFCGAPQRNDFCSQPIPGLEKVHGWINHMKEMGINALYLGPVFESTAHGYDTADYYWVDRRLGTNDTLKDLVNHLHNNGIKVILDGVFNHVGRNFWAFRDIQEKGLSSKYCSWLHNLSFDRRSPFGDPFSYEGWNGHFDLVKLNLHNHEVKEHLLSAVRTWMEEFNIDGLRIDAADCVELNFLKELSHFTKSLRKDFFLVGEIIHGDYRKWANSDILDTVTNYECYKGLYSSLNDKNYFEIAYALNRQSGEFGLYNNLPLYNFADNHDVNRVASQLKNKAHLFPLYCLLFTMPGMPSIYYGSEWGIQGIKQNGSDESLRPCIELNPLYNEGNKDLLNAVKAFAMIRKTSKALRYGNYKQLLIKHEQFAFLRQYEDETVIVILNSSNEKLSLDLNVPLSDGVVFKDILNHDKDIVVKNNKLTVDSLWPSWGKILFCKAG